MHIRIRLLLTAVAAASVLAATVGAASARRLELSNQRFRAVWQTAPMIIETTGGRAICPVTMEGSFHSRTLSKVSGQLIGYVTRIASVNCGTAGGAREFTFLAETLPWHIRYSSFTGSLPAITKITIQVIGLSFLLRLELAGSCLYRSTAAFPAIFEFERNTTTGEIDRLITLETTKIRRLGEEMPFCPAEATLAASGVVTVLGSDTTRIIVRLVQ